MCKIIKNQVKKFFGIILTMVCASLLHQTALRAQLINPTLPAGIDENSGTTSAQGYVTAIAIDSSDPANTKVRYSLSKGTITTSTFYAPGIPNGISENSNLSGNFYFTFDQSDVPIGTSNITLQYRLSGSDSIHTSKFTVSRSQYHNANGGDYWILALKFTHNVYEYYDILAYSKVPSTNTSKLIFAKKAQASLTAESASVAPDDYDEGHVFYDDSNGEYYLQPMLQTSWQGVDPPGVVTMERTCDINKFLKESSSLRGKGTASVTYDLPGATLNTIAVKLIPMG